MCNIRPGIVVKDKEGKVNYGLPMNVIDEHQSQAMVAFLNLDGNYQESWLGKDQLEEVPRDTSPNLPIFPRMC